MKHLPKVGTIVVVKSTGTVGTVDNHCFRSFVDTQAELVGVKGKGYLILRPERLRYATPVEKLRYKLSGS